MSSTSTKPALTLRPANPSDFNLIRHDWYLSYRNGAKHIGSIRPDVFARGQNSLMNFLLDRCPPIVATLEAVPDEVVGWVCRELSCPLTHYVYVKHAYRRIGIASTLAANTLSHSHQTRAGELLFRKLGSLYDPFTLILPE